MASHTYPEKVESGISEAVALLVSNWTNNAFAEFVDHIEDLVNGCVTSSKVVFTPLTFFFW